MDTTTTPPPRPPLDAWLTELDAALADGRQHDPDFLPGLRTQLATELVPDNDEDARWFARSLRALEDEYAVAIVARPRRVRGDA